MRSPTTTIDGIAAARRRSLALAVGGILAVGAIVASGLWWWRTETAARPGLIRSDDAAQVAVGRDLYAQRCVQCHGDKLQGQPNWRLRQANGRLPAPPHDASGHTWHHPDEQLFGMVKLGLKPYAPAGYESDMPAFENLLSDEQIRAVLAFIESTWPTRIRDLQRKASLQTEP